MEDTYGSFFIGCNYWASESGIYMWRRWNADNVDQDFDVLSKHGCTVLRVFPLWPDFQPLNRMRASGNRSAVVLYKDGPLPNTAGVDETMVERFRQLCQMAENHGIRLIVGLVTGWMSGRCFVPPALEAQDPLNDSESIQWQVRYVRYLVRALKTQQSIKAWDLGNECNCMGTATDSFHAWNWTNAIASAIRLEDDCRPVISGMHGLDMSERACWKIAEQAELTDVLTTHPYPLFTPNCNLGPSNSMRGALHGVAESLYYAGVGHKPCFIEEAGSLGPGVQSERRAGQLCRIALQAAWAHNIPGFLWWCAFRQNHLDYSPYDDMAVERDLGLFTQDYRPKPQALVLKEFGQQLKDLPTLPPHSTDVTVLLTRDQANWPVAYGCFLLAKQAGFDVVFQNAEDELQPAKAYWLPSLTGLRGISRRRYRALLEAVRDGALLVASGFGILEPFETVFGLEVDYRFHKNRALVISDMDIDLSLADSQRLLPTRARILLADDKKEPVLTSCGLGKGECRYIVAPLEHMAGIMGSEDTSAYWRIIGQAFSSILDQRMIRKQTSELGITEYGIDSHHAMAVVQNYSNCPHELDLVLQNGWQISPNQKLQGQLGPQKLAILNLVR